MSAKGATAGKGAAGKGAAGKRAKRPGGAGDAGGAAVVPSVANHPRAHQSVRQVKALAGLLAFAATLWLSTQAEVPLALAGERALGAGIAGYLVAWGCAVSVWRALLAAEVRAHIAALEAERDAAA